MMVQHTRRCREYTGPTPNSVAIRAKPTNKRPVEYLILEGRRRDELRDQAIAETKYQNQCDLKSEWEKATDKRIQRNTIVRRVDRLMQSETFNLEDRRERLREMLLKEEEDHIKEMEAKEETTIERQAKMRERAKFLKQKHEQERLQFVQEKLDQRWREECEELRATLSKRHQDDVFTERSDQIRMKEEQKKREKEIESMYADLWEKDVQAKKLREEQAAHEQMERNRETLRILQLQSEAIEKQKEEEKQLKEMEAAWLAEQQKMREQEEEFLRQEKVRKQQAAKRARDISIRLKNEKEAREKQEELALDMKILEKLLDDTRNEAMEDKQRKKELREENLRFMQYCALNRKEEEEREKALENHVNAEVEKQWAKKMEQYRKERAARKRLMENVMKTRQEQMEERKRIANALKDAEFAEKEAMFQAWQEHERIEKANKERALQKNRDYQAHLSMQIDYQAQMKQKEKDEEREEFLLGQEAEKEYQRRLKEALQRPANKIHPIRLMASHRSKSN
ncbi:cilia- and flagella-associated protein 53-like [Actinia tenebrosa]|uniref:Cilia- and flagella-associated protein 53 n=1 Tax=Actinia tenebrosa TaxID=6105 RepID=A0A6P8IFR8_ACTTE|nr:cilia- and flagella-associated protein 53-like [Actinia tenebrosa]